MTDRPTYADFVDVRIFFEGVLFEYAKSVTVIDSPHSTECRIQVPPSMNLNPEDWAGMTCHIFYANKRVIDKFGKAPPKGMPSDWPILFQGELKAFDRQKSVQNETVQLKFTSHVRHFDQTMLFFYDPGRDEPIETMQMSRFLGNLEIDIDMDGVLSRSTRILTSLQNRIEELEDVAGYRNIAFTSIVLEILREARNRHISFRMFDDKFKLSQRFASFVDPDVKEILDIEAMRTLVDKRMQGFGSQTPITKIMEVATNLMQYDWLHISQPKKREGLSEIHNRSAEGISEDAEIIRQSAEQATEEIIWYINKSIDGNINPDPEGTIVDRLRNIPDDFGDVTFIPRRNFTNRVVSKSLEQEVSVGVVIQDLVNERTFPATDDMEPSEDGEVEGFNRRQSRISAGAEIEESAELMVQDEIRLAAQDEINEFTVVPNMEFSQPPRCNVIMPYSFRSFSMSRNHMREITRLYARVPMMPSAGRMAQTWFLAPSSQAYFYTSEDGSSQMRSAYNDFHDAMDLETPDLGEEQ